MRTILILGILGLGALASESDTREGYLMPFACSSREAGPETHTTTCALKEECVDSGFGLLVEGRFYPFDDRGDTLAHRYFETTKKTDDHWMAVAGDFSGDEVQVETLRPAKH